MRSRRTRSGLNRSPDALAEFPLPTVIPLHAGMLNSTDDPEMIGEDQVQLALNCDRDNIVFTLDPRYRQWQGPFDGTPSGFGFAENATIDELLVVENGKAVTLQCQYTTNANGATTANWSASLATGLNTGQWVFWQCQDKQFCGNTVSGIRWKTIGVNTLFGAVPANIIASAEKPAVITPINRSYPVLDRTTVTGLPTLTHLPHNYTFTVTAANATSGAVYQAANGANFTVITTIAAGVSLFVSGSTAPSPTSGTLTRISGTGDATITYSSFAVTTTGATNTNDDVLKYSTVTNVTVAHPTGMQYVWTWVASSGTMNFSANQVLYTQIESLLSTSSILSVDSIEISQDGSNYVALPFDFAWSAAPGTGLNSVYLRIDMRPALATLVSFASWRITYTASNTATGAGNYHRIHYPYMGGMLMCEGAGGLFDHIDFAWCYNNASVRGQMSPTTTVPLADVLGTNPYPSGTAGSLLQPGGCIVRAAIPIPSVLGTNISGTTNVELLWRDENQVWRLPLYSPAVTVSQKDSSNQVYFTVAPSVDAKYNTQWAVFPMSDTINGRLAGISAGCYWKGSNLIFANGYIYGSRVNSPFEFIWDATTTVQLTTTDIGRPRTVQLTSHEPGIVLAVIPQAVLYMFTRKAGYFTTGETFATAGTPARMPNVRGVLGPNAACAYLQGAAIASDDGLWAVKVPLSPYGTWTDIYPMEHEELTKEIRNDYQALIASGANVSVVWWRNEIWCFCGASYIRRSISGVWNTGTLANGRTVQQAVSDPKRGIMLLLDNGSVGVLNKTFYTDGGTNAAGTNGTAVTWTAKGKRRFVPMKPLRCRGEVIYPTTPAGVVTLTLTGEEFSPGVLTWDAVTNLRKNQPFVGHQPMGRWWEWQLQGTGDAIAKGFSVDLAKASDRRMV